MRLIGRRSTRALRSVIALVLVPIGLLGCGSDHPYVRGFGIPEFLGWVNDVPSFPLVNSIEINARRRTTTDGDGLTPVKDLRYELIHGEICSISEPRCDETGTLCDADLTRTDFGLCLAIFRATHRETGEPMAECWYDGLWLKSDDKTMSEQSAYADDELSKCRDGL